MFTKEIFPALPSGRWAWTGGGRAREAALPDDGGSAVNVGRRDA